MSASKRVALVVGVVLAVIVAIFVTVAVRRYTAQQDIASYKQDIASYKQEVENIRNYPKNYSKGATADKGYLTEAMNYDGNNFEAALLYAEALHDEGKFDDAIKFYSKAISVAPDSTDGYWYRSQCYASLKKYDKAIG